MPLIGVELCQSRMAESEWNCSPRVIFRSLLDATFWLAGQSGSVSLVDLFWLGIVDICNPTCQVKNNRFCRGSVDVELDFAFLFRGTGVAGAAAMSWETWTASFMACLDRQKST